MGWRQFDLALGYAKNLGETQRVNTDEINSPQQSHGDRQDSSAALKALACAYLGRYQMLARDKKAPQLII